MGSAPCASHGPPPHAPALVPRNTDVALRDWPSKTGPSRSRIEFLRRRKQSRGAPDAPIDPGLVGIVEPPGVGQLRCPGSRRCEGGRRKALPPRSLVADDLRYSQGGGHCAATIRESDLNRRPEGLERSVDGQREGWHVARGGKQHDRAGEHAKLPPPPCGYFTTGFDSARRYSHPHGARHEIRAGQLDYAPSPAAVQ